MELSVSVEELIRSANSINNKIELFTSVYINICSEIEYFINEGIINDADLDNIQREFTDLVNLIKDYSRFLSITADCRQTGSIIEKR